MLLVVVAVLFVIWSFRVRANAEKISDRRHRWSRRWLVFAWLIPIVNLWWPKQLVDDIWAASDPRFADVSEWRRPWLVRAWWMVWLLYLGLDRVVDRIVKPSSADLEALRRAALSEIMVAPVGITAALLAIVVVWRLSGIQDTRRRELERVSAG